MTVFNQLMPTQKQAAQIHFLFLIRLVYLIMASEAFVLIFEESVSCGCRAYAGAIVEHR